MKKILLFIVFLSVGSTFASQDLYPFASVQDAKHFSEFTSEVRCLVCQNQSIADSHAPIANDLRGVVYDMMIHGKSDDQIKQYLVERFGDYVLFNPPITHKTILLWVMPLLMLLLGAVIVLQVNRRRSA